MASKSSDPPASHASPATSAVPGRLQVALAQIAPQLGNLDFNLDLHESTIAAARDAGAGLIVFPELSLTGYYLRDIVPDVAIPADDRRLARLALAAGDAPTVVGFVERGAGDRCYNSAAWLEGGEVRHVHRKVYLPTYGLFDEGRYFASGSRFRAFDSRIGRVGLAICEDFWHVSVAAIYQAEDVDWLICPANSPARGVSTEEVDTADTYLHVARTYAELLGAGVVVANRAGVEEGLCFWGGSFVIGPDGRRLGRAPAFDPALTCVSVDRAEWRRRRIAVPLGRDSRLDVTLTELQRIQRRRDDE